MSEVAVVWIAVVALLAWTAIGVIFGFIWGWFTREVYTSKRKSRSDGNKR